jgi:Secretion system C-terminal sorting domain
MKTPKKPIIMNKKTLLTSFALMLGLAVSAQTHFSQTVGINTVISTANSGFASLKTSTGNFMTVGVSSASGFEIRTYNTSGTMLLTTKVASSVCMVESISTVTELDANSILVTGTGTVSSAYVFYLAKINLLTNAVTITTKSTYSFSYTKGPKAFTTGSSIYAVFPQFNQFDINKFDANLNPIWSKTCEADTVTGKNPGTDTEWRPEDSSIIVVGKCDSIFGQGEYDEDGGCDSMRLFQINGYTRVYGMSRAADGSMLVAGLNMNYDTYNTRPVVFKIGANGNIVWARILNAVETTSTFARFVDVIELPNGNILALATTTEAYSDTYFNGAVTFDANGTLLGSTLFGVDPYTTTGKTYQLYDIKAYADGLLMSGIENESSYNSNVMIFSDFNFNTVCVKSQVTMNSTPLAYGNTKNYAGSAVKIGDGVLATTSSFGLLTMGANTGTQVCAISTSINEVEMTETSVYPNPVTVGTDLNINMSEAGNYTINVISTTGAMVSSTSLNGSATTINTTNMSAGLYIVNVYTNGKLVNSNKISVR